MIRCSYDFQALLQRSQTKCISQTALLTFEALPDLSPALPGVSPAIPGAPRLVVGGPRLVAPALPVTLKAGRNALLWSDTLLKLTHLSLHSTSSQTLLQASID